jgi:hypothetical protein
MLHFTQHDIGTIVRIAAAIAWLFATNSARAEKIRTAIPQANLNYLSIYVADAKGFFKEEGLDNETVVISGPLSIAALLSGDVDYSGAGGSGMRAALKGAPIKGIMFQANRVTFFLVVDPSIRSASDLKGKKIAIGSPGDTQDRIMTMFAERGGVAARDIIRISMRGHQHASDGGENRRGQRDDGRSRRPDLRAKRRVDLAWLPWRSFPNALPGICHHGKKNSRQSRADQTLAQRRIARTHVRA